MRFADRLIRLLHLALAGLIAGYIPGAAQTAPLNIPVSFINGRTQLPFDYRYRPAEDIRRAGVRSLNIYLADAQDTFDMQQPYRREIYSERGDKIPYDRNYGNSEGFNQIIYNSDHTIATIQYVDHWIQGCGSNTVFGSTKRFTDYEYKKGKCIRETAGYIDHNGRHASIIKEYTYNAKGQKTFEAVRSPDGDTSLGTRFGNSFLHTYDQRGRPLHSFRIVKAFSKKSDDSLASLSPLLPWALLRQLHPSRDSMLNREFPGFDTTDDETINAQIERQDSIDAGMVELYTDRAQGLTAYNYDQRGAITGRLQFEDDDLEWKDTLVYDASNRLIRWETEYPGHYESKPTKAVWTFRYDTDNRVTGCSFYDYGKSDKKGNITLQEEHHYTFTYSGGMIQQIAEENERAYDDYFSAELNDERIRKNSLRYLVQYKME